MITRSKEKPIVFKDGVKVDMSIASDQWVDDGIIKEEMEYISKMTEGLSTGTMANDKEYVDLKNRVVAEMINEKVSSLKKKLSVSAKKKNDIYDHARKSQEEALRKTQDYTRQIAEKPNQAIYLDELTGEYKINYGITPVSLVDGSLYSKRWHSINIENMKKYISRREEDNEKILKEIKVKMDAQKKDNKKPLKKPLKKTMKKKVVKKIVKEKK